MTRYIKPLLILGWLMAAQAWATTVGEIEVKSNTAADVSQDMVKANMTLREGATFAPELLSEDIKKLYATKQFDDIEAKVEPGAGDTVKIVLIITPKTRVNTILIDGNKLISTARLRRRLEQKENAPQDDALLKKDLDSLYEIYRNKGYSDTVIKQRVVPLEESGDIKVVYEIDEKPRHKVRGLEILGNTIFSDGQLKRKMKSDVSFWGYMFPTGYFSEAELKNDLDALRKKYLDRGYLDFKIEKIDRTFNESRTKIYIAVYVDEGQPYKITDVSIRGNVAFETADLEQLVRLTPGTVFNQAMEDDDRNALTAKYNRNGYLDCGIYAQHETDSQNHTVAISYNIKEGRSTRIRNINISGNRVTKDHVIRREMRIHPGDLSDSGKLRASRASLMNLGYFQAVNIIPVSTEDPDLKDLNVGVEEKLTGQLIFGAGVSSTDSVLGTVEVTQSNFDIGNYPTFRGGGQRFRLRAQAGSTRQDYVLSFTEPWLFDHPLRLDVEAWRRETSSNREYDQESIGFSSSLTRKLKTPFWRQSFGYRLEDIRISDFDDTFTQAFIDEEEGSNLVSALSMGFIRDHRDRVLLTSSGSRISINSELGGEFLGSYSTLYKLSLSGDKYWPVFKKSVFKLSGELSTLDNLSGDDPKIFDRYFTGGAGSIRGFKERDVGPVDPGNDEPIGGQSRFLASAELSTPIIKESIFLALFVDTGNVWPDDADWDFGELNVGAGAGLRFFLPIGAISLDYGWPVNREQEHLNRSGRLHFNLGYNF